MTDSLMSQVQEVIANRPAADAAAAAIVDFQGWTFFGVEPAVWVQVSVTPVSQDVAIQSVMLVVLTADGNDLICASVLAANHVPAGWSVDAAAATRIYSISKYGAEVQAWAYVTALAGGAVQPQYSATQHFTVGQ